MTESNEMHLADKNEINDMQFRVKTLKLNNTTNYSNYSLVFAL